ncbi:hypothetical protein FOC1_g10008434 [Fusarium oxysporum f. sp. cubense race 1]|uniref:Uncharacterized protein n=1 Tax=Fusarium oxysporum f. sp. cubense (strain race 1) TaxID=1229664 RepID=N4UIB2_FUSC1|nr:hypothetical protein FOC1_g10008434 [Fusarium oxysporum f. sp. cubense race 1]
MADNNKNIENKKLEQKPLSEETCEDLRRMTAGLTDQTTIETLSRAGMMAKNKREQSHFQRDKAATRVEAAEKEGEAEEDKDTGGSDKEKNKKQT